MEDYTITKHKVVIIQQTLYPSNTSPFKTQYMGRQFLRIAGAERKKIYNFKFKLLFVFYLYIGPQCIFHSLCKY